MLHLLAYKSNLHRKCNIGYVFEVDLHCAESLYTSCTPLTRSRRSNNAILPICFPPTPPSPYENLFTSSALLSSTEKMLKTVEDKHKNVFCLKNLKLYISLGLEMKAVYRVLTFKQSALLKPFIHFNTHKKQLTIHLLQFCKRSFQVNAVYAVYKVSLENVRKHVDF